MASLFSEGGRKLFPLRPYQNHCIPKFRQGIKEGHFHSIGQAPCRYGKTVVSAHIIDSALRKGGRCLFAAPRISLVDQTLESLQQQGFTDIGVMQADHYLTNSEAPLQIACFDTLYRRKPEDFDLVILDEVHLCDARMWELKKRWKIVLAWTATPWAKGLGLHFSKLHVFATIPEMIEYNRKDAALGLVPGKGIGPRADLIAGVDRLRKNDAGEFVESEACAFMDRHEVVADEVETWLRTRQEGRHPGDRTLHFIRRRASAQPRLEAFAAHGVRFEYIDSYTNDRSPIFRQFRERKIQGIISVGCVREGVDLDARCIIDAAPSNSEMTIVQKLMRGGTPGEGKEYYWLNDHAGNANRFGWYEDIRHDMLDCTPPHVKGCAYPQEEVAPQEKKQRECPACRSFVGKGALSCPVCGKSLYDDPTVVLEGQLGELVHGTSVQKKKSARKREYTMQEKQEWFSGLLWIYQKRGSKNPEGAAAHRYREKFGVWPNKMERTARQPSLEVQIYERHGRIKYARSQANLCGHSEDAAENSGTASR